MATTSGELAMAKERMSAKKIEILEKVDRVMDLRKKGFTYRMIQRELGISERAVVKYLQLGFKSLQEKSSAQTEELMLMQNARLEDMYRGLSGRIDKGESRAIEVGIKVLERQSRLFGLDAPAKQETLVTYQHLSDAELLDEAKKFQLDVHLHPPEQILLPGEQSLPLTLQGEVQRVFQPAEVIHVGPSDPESTTTSPVDGIAEGSQGVSGEPTGVSPSHSD